MRGFKLPIMIGCYDKADKCSVWFERNGGYSLLICRLKKREDRGEIFGYSNIGRVICHIHFCKLDALKVFAKGVNEMVERWEEEQNDEQKEEGN